MTSKYDYAKLWEGLVGPKTESVFSKMRDPVRKYSHQGKPQQYRVGYEFRTGDCLVENATSWLVVADRERKAGNLADAVQAINKINFADGFGLIEEEKRQELYQAAIRRLDRMMPSILESGNKEILYPAFHTGAVLQKASSKKVRKYTPEQINSIIRDNR